MYHQPLHYDRVRTWNAILKNDNEKLEFEYGAEARILQEKKFLLWITKDDREAKMKEVNSKLESFKNLLRAAGISFQENTEISHGGSPRSRDYNDWERVEIINKHLSYTVNPEQRLSYLKNVCMSPQLLKIFMGNYNEYEWYKRLTSNTDAMEMASKAAEKLVECILAEAPYSEKGWEKEQDFYCGSLHICPYYFWPSKYAKYDFEWQNYSDDDWVRYKEYGFEPLEEYGAQVYMAIIVAEKACNILSNTEGVEAACIDKLDTKDHSEGFEGIVCTIQVYFDAEKAIRASQPKEKTLKTW